MAHRYDHLRDKAIQLRTEQQYSLDQLVECLSLPKTTVWEWIKAYPLNRAPLRTEAQYNGTKRMQAIYTAKREAAYQQGMDEAPQLLQDPIFRDFVVLYMAEGYKRNRNTIAIVNSDPDVLRLSYRVLRPLSNKPFRFRMQYHADHDPDELKCFWGEILNIAPQVIKIMRKSNSNQLTGRKYRSVHGLMTIEVSDTYLRSRLQAWMDTVKNQW
jgi:hypothetical protein